MQGVGDGMEWCSRVHQGHKLMGGSPHDAASCSGNECVTQEEKQDKTTPFCIEFDDNNGCDTPRQQQHNKQPLVLALCMVA